MRNRHLAPLLMLLCSLLLAGCGQKGPLYLPKPDPAPVPDNDTELKTD